MIHHLSSCLIFPMSTHALEVKGQRSEADNTRDPQNQVSGLNETAAVFMGEKELYSEDRGAGFQCPKGHLPWSYNQHPGGVGSGRTAPSWHGELTLLICTAQVLSDKVGQEKFTVACLGSQASFFGAKYAHRSSAFLDVCCHLVKEVWLSPSLKPSI